MKATRITSDQSMRNYETTEAAHIGGCPYLFAALPPQMQAAIIDVKRKVPKASLFQIGDAYTFPNEASGFSVYRINFKDDHYVGITGRSVMERMEEHFGAGHRGNLEFADLDIQERLRLGLGNLRVVARIAAGMHLTVEVLHSGLSKQEAVLLESQEGEAQNIGLLPVDPLNSAVARLRYGIQPRTKRKA